MRRLLLTLPLVLAPTLAVAQPDLIDVEEEQKQEALDVGRRAYDEQQAGNFGEASRLYRQSYCLFPDPQIVFNLGTVARSLGNNTEAAELFTLYLTIDPNGALSADAQALLGKLGVKGAVAAATITCPKRVPVVTEPGDTTGPGDTTDTTPPGGETTSPPPGEATPRVRQTGGTLRWVGLGTLVAGVAAAGVGVYYGLEAKGHSDAISNNTMGWTQELLDRQAQGEQAEQRQIIFLSAGGAAVALGTILMIVGGPTTVTERGGVAVRPILTGGAGGLALSGAF